MHFALQRQTTEPMDALLLSAQTLLFVIGWQRTDDESQQQTCAASHSRQEDHLTHNKHTRNLPTTKSSSWAALHQKLDGQSQAPDYIYNLQLHFHSDIDMTQSFNQ